MMKTQELHENLAAGLAQRGLPLEYAERTAAELSDHHRDLVAELTTTAGMDEPAAQAEASSRLGDQKTLIKKSVREYQRRHWCGRWPLLTVLIGPIALLAVVWVGSGLLCYYIGELFDQGTRTPLITTTAQYVAGMAGKVWFVFLTPAAVVYFLARRASSAALSWRWTVLTACILGMIVGSMKCGLVDTRLQPNPMTDMETGQPIEGNVFVVAVPMPQLYSSFKTLFTWYSSDISLICQLLLPLVVAGIFLWRTQLLAQRNQRNQLLGT
jgi:hypothetical protein